MWLANGTAALDPTCPKVHPPKWKFPSTKILLSQKKSLACLPKKNGHLLGVKVNQLCEIKRYLFCFEIITWKEELHTGRKEIRYFLFYKTRHSIKYTSKGWVFSNNFCDACWYKKHYRINWKNHIHFLLQNVFLFPSGVSKIGLEKKKMDKKKGTTDDRPTNDQFCIPIFLLQNWRKVSFFWRKFHMIE